MIAQRYVRLCQVGKCKGSRSDRPLTAPGPYKNLALLYAIHEGKNVMFAYAQRPRFLTVELHSTSKTWFQPWDGTVRPLASPIGKQGLNWAWGRIVEVLRLTELWLDCCCLDSRGNISTPKKTPRKELLNKSIRFDETIASEGLNDSEMNKSVSNPVEMHFTLAKYLPQHAAIQTSFDMIISGEF